jgi:hypothetical protein
VGLGSDLLGKDGVDLRAGVLGVAEELLVPVLEERLLNERVDKGRAASAGRANHHDGELDALLGLLPSSGRAVDHG